MNEVSGLYALFFVILAVNTVIYWKTEIRIALLKEQVANLQAVIDSVNFPNHSSPRNTPPYWQVRNRLDYQ